MKEELFKSLHIDEDAGVFEVNGRDIADSVTYAELVSENGCTSLRVSVDKFYTTDRKIGFRPDEAEVTVDVQKTIGKRNEKVKKQIPDIALFLITFVITFAICQIIIELF